MRDRLAVRDPIRRCRRRGSGHASYGADEAGSDGGTSSGIDSGAHGIDSGVTDSGGGGGGGKTAGGDCIGDPQAPFGYDFACDLALSFDTNSPCTTGMNDCAADECCYVDPAAMCYSDYPDAGTQCVPLGM